MCTALQDLRSGVADLHQARGRARVLSVETPLPARYARHPLPQAGEGKAHRALIHLDALLTDHRCPAREIAVDLRFELRRGVADRLHDLRGELRLELGRVDRLG